MSISSISSASPQTIQPQPPEQVNRRRAQDATDNPEAGAVATATVAIQQNQNTIRVEAELQQQLTAVQASNISQIRGQNSDATNQSEAPVTIAPEKIHHTSDQELANQAAALQARLQAQAEQNLQQATAAAEANRAAQQAENTRQPSPPPVTPAQQYEANQTLLQSAGSNTQQVSTLA